MKKTFSQLLCTFIVLLVGTLASYSQSSKVVTTNTAGVTVSFSTSGEYEWEWDNSNSRLRSTNRIVNSSTSETTMTINAPQECTFSFDWSVSSEPSYDKLTVTLDGTTIVDAVSGIASDTYSGSLTKGTHTLVMSYTKDIADLGNDDRAYIKNVKFSIIEEKKLLIGDIDGDGKITMADINEMVNIYLGKSESRTMNLDEFLETIEFTGSVIQNGNTKFYPVGFGHDYVDLGLSVKWATCNVGANKPEEYGDYFAWGETKGYSQDTSDGHLFDWANYSLCNGSNTTMKKYCGYTKYGTVDNKTVLDKEDDAASVNWGGSWRMPTRAEQDELRENCTWTWTTLNGVNGCKVTSNKNGNYIFLPAAGNRNNNSFGNAGSFGYYWSSSLSQSQSSLADFYFISSDGVDWNGYGRYSGRSIRAVCP